MGCIFITHSTRPVLLLRATALLCFPCWESHTHSYANRRTHTGGAGQHDDQSQMEVWLLLFLSCQNCWRLFFQLLPSSSPPSSATTAADRNLNAAVLKATCRTIFWNCNWDLLTSLGLPPFFLLGKMYADYISVVVYSVRVHANTGSMVLFACCGMEQRFVGCDRASLKFSFQLYWFFRKTSQ